MRYIRVPKEPIVLRSLDGSRALNENGTPADPITFQTWLRVSVLLDLKFGKTAKDLMQAADIGQKADRAKDVLELSEAEWSAVAAVVNEPTSGYNPRVALQLMPFLRAMLDASTEEPESLMTSVA